MSSYVPEVIALHSDEGLETFLIVFLVTVAGRFTGAPNSIRPLPVEGIALHDFGTIRGLGHA